MSNSEFIPKGHPEKETETAPNHAVLTGPEFINDFCLETGRAQERVWAQAMAMERGELQDEFYWASIDASRRGLDVRLRPDWFSHLTSKDGIHSIINVQSRIGLAQRPGQHRIENERMFKALQEEGVDIRFTNYPKISQMIFPFTGRSHMKIYIVDDVVYLGGINIEEVSMTEGDFVVKFVDKELADNLVYEFDNGSNKQKLDRVRDLPNRDRIIIDAGIPGQSVILDQAVYLVENAKRSVRNISFFTPDEPMARAFSNAHEQGKDVEVLSPQIKLEPLNPYSYLDQWNKLVMEVKDLRVPFARPKKAIHAKLLIVDESVAMFGSHNLMSSGVRAGTQEIAYVTRQPDIIDGLMKYYNGLANGALTQAA